MTFKPLFLSGAAAVLLFASCQQSESTDTTTPTENLINTGVYPDQPMQVDASANLRLSYTGRTVTDSSVFYQVMATYNGENVGFNLSIPKGEEGTAHFSGTGKASDKFLHFMQGIYGQPADTTTRFSEYASAHYYSLGTLLSGDSATHSHDSAGRLHDSTALAPESPVTQNKLVFRSVSNSDSAELYLDINEKDHWIELSEKDTIYRAWLVRALTQQRRK